MPPLGCGSRLLLNFRLPAYVTGGLPPALEARLAALQLVDTDALRLVLFLQQQPSATTLKTRLAALGLAFACLTCLRIAGSLLRYEPEAVDVVVAAGTALAAAIDLWTVWCIGTAAALLAQFLQPNAKLVELMGLRHHVAAFEAAATGRPTAARADAAGAVAAAVAAGVRNRRRRYSNAAFVGSTTLAAASAVPGVSVMPERDGGGGASQPRATLGASFPASSRLGGDAVDAERVQALGLASQPNAAATVGLGLYSRNGGSSADDSAALCRAYAATIDAVTEAQPPPREADGGGCGGSGLLAGLGATLGGGLDLGVSRLLQRQWRGDSGRMLLGRATAAAGGAADGDATGGGCGDSTSGGCGSVEDDPDALSTIAPLSALLRPYFAATPLLRRALGTPVLPLALLRAHLRLDVAALDRTAAAVHRVLRRHWRAVLLRGLQRNARELAELCPRLGASAFLDRLAAGGGGAVTVALPGVRGGQPATLDDLVAALAGAGDMRFLKRRPLEKPPAAAGGGSGGGAAAFPPFFTLGQAAPDPRFSPAALQQQAAAGLLAAAAAGGGRVNRTAAPVAAAPFAVVDLWQERAELEEFLAPPAAAAALAAAAAGGGVALPGPPGAAGVGLLKAYSLRRLGEIFQDAAGGLSTAFRGDALPVVASGSGGGVDPALQSLLPTDAELLLHYLFTALDAEVLRLARAEAGPAALRRPAASTKQQINPGGSDTKSGSDAIALRLPPPPERAVVQLARLRLADRPFSRLHLLRCPIPPPPVAEADASSLQHLASPSPSRGGAERAAAAAAAATRDPRSPLSLRELAGTVAGTAAAAANAPAAVRPRVRLYHFWGADRAAHHLGHSPHGQHHGGDRSSGGSQTLVGVTNPALAALLGRQRLAALLSRATGGAAAAAGAAALGAGGGCGGQWDAALAAAGPAATAAGLDVGNSLSARVAVPRAIALFVHLLARAGADADGVGSAAASSTTADNEAVAPASFCGVPLGPALAELATAAAVTAEGGAAGGPRGFGLWGILDD